MNSHGYLNHGPHPAADMAVEKELAGLRLQQLQVQGVRPDVNRPSVVGEFEGWLGHVRELRAKSEMSLEAARQRLGEQREEVAQLERVLRALDSAEKAAICALQDAGPATGATLGRG
jgi:hypothetical protein